ncbi:MAG: HD domain-containing protein [Candidatus Levyibacteriota bacterium]
MEFHLQKVVEDIKSHPLFLKLKDVTENIEGYHDHESVFIHSVKTANIALQEREGNFITNPEAKKKFREFLEEETVGVKRKDIIVLTALLHDCGKILSYRENDETLPMNKRKANTTDQTTCPAHEYWGGQLVAPKILDSLGFDQTLINNISHMVELHSILNDKSYYEVRKDWSIQDLAQDIKGFAQGRFMEGMFNAYCDCFTAGPFQLSKEKIIALFNEPSLYTKREYFIP